MSWVKRSLAVVIALLFISQIETLVTAIGGSEKGDESPENNLIFNVEQGLEEGVSEAEHPGERTTSNVTTWAQFQAAFNNQSVTQINLNTPAPFLTGTTVLNPVTRPLTINLNGTNLQLVNQQIVLNTSFPFVVTGNGLVGRLGTGVSLPVIMSTGISNVVLNGPAISALNGIDTPQGSLTLGASPVGNVTLGLFNATIRTRNLTVLPNAFSTIDSTVSITANGQLTVGAGARLTINGTSQFPALSLGANAVANFTNPAYINIQTTSTSPIALEATAQLNLHGEKIALWRSGNSGSIPSQGWSTLTASLTGVNGQTVLESDPLSFSRVFDSAGFTGYRRVSLGERSTDLDNGSIEKEKGTLQVQYIDQDTGDEILATENFEGEIGETIIVNPKRTSSDEPYRMGYDFSTLLAPDYFDQETNHLVLSEEKVTIVFYFKRANLSFTIFYEDMNGQSVSEASIYEGQVGDAYQIEEKEIPHFKFEGVKEGSPPMVGMIERNQQDIHLVYLLTRVNPLDPLNPESEMNPTNPPILPENQGLLSIDFVSQFNFGIQSISLEEKKYYAQPQYIENEDDSVNKMEERPNYIQVSDRRSDDTRGNGWQLSVRQNGPFVSLDDQELTGAQLQFMNQQVVTAQTGLEPSLQLTNPFILLPGNRRVLLMAQGEEGKGTWIYRFGNENNADESVQLTVPKEATPTATTYKTTLSWEISMVPGN